MSRKDIEQRLFVLAAIGLSGILLWWAGTNVIVIETGAVVGLLRFIKGK